MAESNQARYFRPDPIPSELSNAFSRWVDQQLHRVEIASGIQTVVVNNNETKIVYLEGNDTVQDGRLDVHEGRLDALEALPPMRMLAPYLGTETVPAGTVVSDNGWLMHANQDTSERAAPQPAGPPSWEMPDIPAFTESQATAVVWSGHEYTLTVGGWMQEVQIWVPELTNDTNYRILLIDQTDPANPIVNAVEEPTLRENAWTSIALGSKVYPAGSNLAIIIDALNSGASQTKYVEQTGYWPANDPAWATMRGILRIGGVDQPADTTAFGVRLKFQPGAVSTHWDFMALSD